MFVRQISLPSAAAVAGIVSVPTLLALAAFSSTYCCTELVPGSGSQSRRWQSHQMPLLSCSGWSLKDSWTENGEVVLSKGATAEWEWPEILS